jgi:hypothetical protein
VETFWSHTGLLDMSGRPLLYSPAFCRFDMDLMGHVARCRVHVRWLNTKEEV